MNKLWMFALVLSACSDPPEHKGKVTDRWGKPIAGVTLGYTGSAAQLVSGPDGSFTIPVQATVRVCLMKPGLPARTLNSLPCTAIVNLPSSPLTSCAPDPV